MPGRYKHTTDVTVMLTPSGSATDHDIELELTFDVYPGREQTMFEPSEPASVSIQTALIVDRNGIDTRRDEAPRWLWRMIEDDEALEAEMLEAAWSDEEARRDDHADMIREDRMMEARHG